MKRIILFCLGLGLLCGVPTRAAAQGAAASPLAVRQPRAGDCTLTIEVPAGTDPASVRVTLDSVTAPLRFTVKQRTPLVVALQDPLLSSSNVTVTVGTLPPASVRVAAPPEGAIIPASCSATPRAATFDEREVFEASGFLGEVFDNFAPNVAGGYVNDSTNNIKSRWTAGVEAQYRLKGSKDSQVQVWLTSHVLHGLRSADVKCGDTPDAAQCARLQNPADPGAFLSKDAVKNFFYVLQGASTIEAHVDLRVEFATIQQESQVPARLYWFARAGFLDLAGAPRVFDADSMGIGLIASKGVFRSSYAQVGVGQSRQFETDKRFARAKINGVLVFDLMPGLSADGILSKLGAGSRFFLALSIDRNFRKGPDAVQTYVGVDFDLRRMFGSF